MFFSSCSMASWIIHIQLAVKQKKKKKTTSRVLEASYYLIDPCLYMLNPMDMYKEALITFCLSI